MAKNFLGSDYTARHSAGADGVAEDRAAMMNLAASSGEALQDGSTR